MLRISLARTSRVFGINCAGSIKFDCLDVASSHPNPNEHHAHHPNFGRSGYRRRKIGQCERSDILGKPQTYSSQVLNNNN